jgi:hypothetical protein
MCNGTREFMLTRARGKNRTDVHARTVVAVLMTLLQSACISTNLDNLDRIRRFAESGTCHVVYCGAENLHVYLASCEFTPCHYASCITATLLMRRVATSQRVHLRGFWKASTVEGMTFVFNVCLRKTLPVGLYDKGLLPSTAGTSQCATTARGLQHTMAFKRTRSEYFTLNRGLYKNL